MTNKFLAFWLGSVICTVLISQVVIASTLLTQFQWQYRILIVNSNDALHLSTLDRAREILKEELQVRKLLLITLSDNKTSCSPSICANLDLDSLKNDVQIRPEQAILIGLDGGIKERYAMTEFEFDTLFGDIDLMPMRRAEMQ